MVRALWVISAALVIVFLWGFAQDATAANTQVQLAWTAASGATSYGQIRDDQRWPVPDRGVVSNSNVDAPHKEVRVNVTNWSSRGAGPYVVNFVAKNKAGAVIGQKAVAIYIAH